MKKNFKTNSSILYAIPYTQHNIKRSNHSLASSYLKQHLPHVSS